MSATSEERGNKRTNVDGRQMGQQRQPTNSREPNAQMRRTGKPATGVQNPNNKTPELPSTPNLPPQDEHIPLNGFNAAEIDILLKKGFDTKTPVYKPESLPQRQGSVWGTKGAMANGKDFWLELRKQVSVLQQTGGVSQGG